MGHFLGGGWKDLLLRILSENLMNFVFGHKYYSFEDNVGGNIYNLIGADAIEKPSGR